MRAVITRLSCQLQLCAAGGRRKTGLLNHSPLLVLAHRGSFIVLGSSCEMKVGERLLLMDVRKNGCRKRSSQPTDTPADLQAATAEKVTRDQGHFQSHVGNKRGKGSEKGEVKGLDCVLKPVMQKTQIKKNSEDHLVLKRHLQVV